MFLLTYSSACTHWKLTFFLLVKCPLHHLHAETASRDASHAVTHGCNFAHCSVFTTECMWLVEVTANCQLTDFTKQRKHQPAQVELYTHMADSEHAARAS